MPLSHRSFGNARVVTPQGRLDHDNCESFQTDLAEHLQACSQQGAALVLDLSGLEYVSSAGLRCFMLAAKQARAQNGYLAVAAVQPLVQEILEISKFTLVLRVLPSVREAVAAASATGLAAFERG